VVGSGGRVAALRFFFVRTLKRCEYWEELPYPKDPKDRRRLPTVLSLEEVARLIGAAGTIGEEGETAVRQKVTQRALFDWSTSVKTGATVAMVDVAFLDVHSPGGVDDGGRQRACRLCALPQAWSAAPRS
jgi:hypothetical protein